jgi:CRP/FNR family cyclic AMP-dependent transcriptional regulator
VDAATLKTIPLFAELSDRDRAALAAWTDVIEVPAGKHLVDEGRFAYEFFAILEGSAEVRRGEAKIADLGPGDFFGEVGLLGQDHVRTATVVASSPLRVVVMLNRDFASMARSLPSVAGRVRDACAERIRRDAAD